jgi:Arc/MetJ-type ribon-helix-helix transcriptional regulator
VKLSVSLPDEDVAFLDALTVELGLAWRSAALQAAVRALRESRLEAAYADAIAAWEASDDSTGWDTPVADGLR